MSFGSHRHAMLSISYRLIRFETYGSMANVTLYDESYVFLQTHLLFSHNLCYRLLIDLLCTQAFPAQRFATLKIIFRFSLFAS